VTTLPLWLFATSSFNQTNDAADHCLNMEATLLDWQLPLEIPFIIFTTDKFGIEFTSRLQIRGRQCTLYTNPDELIKYVKGTE
jgi:hypothetical protein